MYDHSRAVALRMIKREMEIQATSDYPCQRFGLGLIEGFRALQLITEPEYCANIKLLSSLVDDRQAYIRTQLHAQRLAALKESA